jgi:hypothetical protein
MTITRVLKYLASVILSRFNRLGARPRSSHVISTICRFVIAGLASGAALLGVAAAGEGQAKPAGQFAGGMLQMAQSSSFQQRHRPRSRKTPINQARANCRRHALELRRLVQKSCIRGDRLDKARSICVPPKGIFKLYSRWDPAAGRCKPRHRFDGGTCAGGKRRYPPGKHHAHVPSQSVAMFGQAARRVAANLKSCQRNVTGLRNQTAIENIIKKQNCSNARRRNDRSQINLYCK